jgi:uncharacterized protein YjbJ (UPF0337 family)
MNNAKVKGDWQQFAERAKEKWGQLINDDWKLIAGKRDQLLANIQQRYRVSLEDAARKLADLIRVLTGPPGGPRYWRAAWLGRKVGRIEERAVGERDGT